MVVYVYVHAHGINKRSLTYFNQLSFTISIANGFTTLGTRLFMRQRLRQVSDLGVRATVLGIAVNGVLAGVKAAAGVFGNSYALVADAIESGADVLTSIGVLAGVKIAGKPADDNHPYGHGKFEALSGLIVALTLIGAALFIAVQSVREIVTPHFTPAPFTLLVLVAVIIIKEGLFRFVIKIGQSVESTALKTDAWHHRSDAITSLAAFIGISIAILGGPGYESADDYAALLAAAIIATNAIFLLRPALHELVDSAAPPDISRRIREVAEKVPGVLGTHKCHVRKVGFEYVVDLDILCDPDATIRMGHDTAHEVCDAVHREMKSVGKILVHVEPVDDYGRRKPPPVG